MAHLHLFLYYADLILAVAITDLLICRYLHFAVLMIIFLRDYSSALLIRRLPQKLDHNLAVVEKPCKAYYYFIR